MPNFLVRQLTSVDENTSTNNNFNGGNSGHRDCYCKNLILLKCGHSIATSIDNGNTWVDDLTKKTSYSKSIVHFNGNYFLIAGDPVGGPPIDSKFYLYKSTNGSSWEKVFQQQVRINYMYADSKIYLLGENGQLIYSDDGINWNVKRVTGQYLYYMTKLN